jgi:hypothetical protein
MKSNTAGGPSGAAGWQEIEVPDGGGIGAAKPYLVLLLPDAANRSGGRDNTFYYLPKVPRLATDAAGEPALSLTLELSRMPTTAEATILPLIRRGWLALTLTFGLPPEVRGALEAAVGAHCRPLFARSARIEIRANGAVLAAVDGAGAEARMALSAVLERDVALGALAALDRAPSSIEVRASVHYRTAGAETSVHLAGVWAAIYDYLAAKVGSDGLLDEADVQGAFAEMLRDRIVIAERVGSPSAPPRRWTDADAVYGSFKSAAMFILEPRTPGSHYALRRRPHPLMRLDVTETVSAVREAEWKTTAALEDILGGVLEGRDRDRFLRLIGPSGGEGGTVPVPRLVRSRRAPGRIRGEGDMPMQLVASPAAYTSLSLALTPDRSHSPDARALMASDLVRPTGPSARRLWLADDVIIDRLEGPIHSRPLSLPVVDDPSTPVWRDRIKAGQYWYAPAWVPVLPAPGDDPATSTFRFTFETSGVTGGGTPAVGLSGTVRFTLRQEVPQAVQTALTRIGSPPARAVPSGNLSVALDLPFRDEATGATKSQLFPAEIEQAGDTITATVSLLNQWVRLCYGALAYPGFQAAPARLRVAYAYRAYVPVEENRLDLAFGGKIALTEVTTQAHLPARIDKPIFDARRATFHLPHGVLQMEREPDVHPSLAARGSPVAVAARRPPIDVIIEPPELEVPPEVVEEVRAEKYAAQTFIHEESPDALYPCASLGAFYRQVTPEGETVIGCQDTLRLGETVHRQYEELPDLSSSRCRVYRSLQQPGRFLVVPAAYRITRYSAAESGDRAYRPAIMIYALLGTEAAESRYFFRATLEPDLPVFVREGLRERLMPLTPFGQTPILQFPTDPTLQDSDAPTAFRWALPDGIGAPEVHQTWDGFQISLSTGLANALALTTLIESGGLTGDATFTLPDGLKITTTLALDTVITGPWLTGPFSVRIAEGAATLTNHAEQAMSIVEIVTRNGPTAPRRAPIEQTLARDASLSAPLDGPADTVYPVYEPVPQALKLRQMNIFVEDVTTNVIFVNLINYANHALAALQIRARLKDTEHQYALNLKENESESMTMTLPLTTYLENQMLQYQVIKNFTGGEPAAETEWKDWDLRAAGNVISLTWEGIG